MYILSTTFALYFLGSLVNAQTTNDTVLGIAAIEAHFTGADLVPSLLSSFDPSALMTVTFSGVGAITPGQNLSQQREYSHFSRMQFKLILTSWVGRLDMLFTEVAPTPQITVVPANSSVSLQGNYTLVMADANIAGTDESVGQTRHWLVNGVTLTGTRAPPIHRTRVVLGSSSILI